MNSYETVNNILVRLFKDILDILVSLSEKGEKAYLHHKIFHEKMVMAVLDSLNQQETKDLTKALLKLQRFFDDYGKE